VSSTKDCRIWAESMLFGAPSPPFRMVERAVVTVHAVGCLLDVQRAVGGDFELF